MRAVADYITLASFDSIWLLTLLQRSEFGMFYYNICPCRVAVYVWLTEVWSASFQIKHGGRLGLSSVVKMVHKVLFGQV